MSYLIVFIAYFNVIFEKKYWHKHCISTDTSMSNPILTTEEINELLKNTREGIKSGGLWEGETHPFDLTVKNSNAEEKLAAVNELLSSFTERLSESLALTLNTEDLKVKTKDAISIQSQAGIQQLPVSDFTICEWSDDNNGAQGLLGMQRELFFHFYNQIYGGKMEYQKVGKLTELEQKFLLKIIKEFSKNISQAWSHSGNWHVQPSKVLISKDETESLSWSFECFYCEFPVEIEGNIIGSLVGLFPMEMAGALISDNIEGDTSTKSSSQDQFWINAVKHCIKDTPVDLSVLLGTTNLTINQIFQMSVNATYPISVIGGEYPVSLNGKPVFHAGMGSVKDHKAIQIKDKI